MPACLNRPVVPEKIEDMQEGVIYKDRKGYNSCILFHCEICGIPMKVLLSHGEPRWKKCRGCENKSRVKYSPLPDKIEDMVEGVIYKDKWSAACTLHHCDICGIAMIQRIIKGVIENRICHTCCNQTPEKREIMSKAHLGIPMSEDRKQKQSEYMRIRCQNPEWLKHLSDVGKRPCLEETKKKISEANKGQVHSPEQDKEHSIRMKEKFSDPVWKADKLRKWEEGKANMPPEVEEERRKKISAASKEHWSDPEYKDSTIKHLFQSLALSPTKPEKCLDELLQEYFPDQWIYNGDDSCNFRIGGKVPDFLNLEGFPVVIELFSYHHCPGLFKLVNYDRIPKGRIEVMRKYGYRCLIIWQCELEKPLAVVQKIKEFMAVG
jgi:hypothetical protein